MTQCKTKSYDCPAKTQSMYGLFNNKEESYVEDNSVLGIEKQVKEECVEKPEDPMIMEEYEIEELSVDGICGVY